MQGNEYLSGDKESNIFVIFKKKIITLLSQVKRSIYDILSTFRRNAFCYSHNILESLDKREAPAKTNTNPVNATMNSQKQATGVNFLK